MKTLILTTTLVLGAFATSAFAQSTMSNDMATVDANQDKMIDMDEYNTGSKTDMDARFKVYDRNQDGNISAEEFNQGEFVRYDRDRNQSLNEEEYGMYSQDRDAFSNM